MNKGFLIIAGDIESGNIQRLNMEDANYCGLGRCRPNILQACASIGCFTGMFSICGLMTSSLQMYMTSQVSSIEKQFGLSSKQSGFLMSCDEIGFLTTTIFVGYIAPRLHIPHVLSAATMFYGISALLCCLPYALTRLQNNIEIPNATLASRNSSKTSKFINYLCIEESNSSTDVSCIQGRRENEVYGNLKDLTMFIIGLGMVLQGVGKSPRTSLLAEYVDENGQKRKTGFYVGIIVSVAMFGPALSYGLGSVFSNLYVTLQDVPIKPRDPNWIGAWWLGFLVFGIMAMLSAIPIFIFPRRLPGNTKKYPTKKTTFRNQSRTLRLWIEVKGLIKGICRILSSPLFTMCLFASVIQLLAVSIYLTFLVKYYENQYNLPTWKANLVMAGSTILSLCIGTFIGGLVTRKVSMSPAKTMTTLLILQTASTIVFATGLFTGCDQVQIIGPTKYGGIQINSSLSCLHSCDCADSRYFPVCGSDGKTYFSPCFVGCETSVGRSFANCSCVEHEIKTAKIGFCETGCDNLIPYIAMNFVTSILTAIKIMPLYIVKLRSVRNEEKALAVGLSAFVTSLCGWLPGPLISGAFIDSACSLWRESCEGRGSCAFYDNDVFRLKLHGYSLVGRFLVIPILIFCWFYTRSMTQWKTVDVNTDKSNDVEMKETDPDENKLIADSRQS